MIQPAAPRVSLNRRAPVGSSVTCCTSFALMTSIKPDKVPPSSGMYIRPHFSQDNQIHACLQWWFYRTYSHQSLFFSLAKPTLTFPNCCNVGSPLKKKHQTFCLFSAGYDMVNGLEACRPRLYMRTALMPGGLFRIFARVCVMLNSASKFCANLDLWQILMELHWESLQGTISCLWGAAGPGTGQPYLAFGPSFCFDFFLTATV